MELDASLSWLALALTPGLACRLCARLLRKIGLPDRIFHASLTELESCSLPARVAQASYNKDAFKRAEKELAGIRNIPGCGLLNWTEPEYPQNLLQIYDPPQILNMPGLSIVGTRRPTRYGSQMADASAATWQHKAW
jgi:DNA processing protein